MDHNVRNGTVGEEDSPIGIEHGTHHRQFRPLVHQDGPSFISEVNH